MTIIGLQALASLGGHGAQDAFWVWSASTPPSAVEAIVETIRGDHVKTTDLGVHGYEWH